MKTIIPAQPGFFVVYPDGKKIPIIAWEISDNGCGDFNVLPITPNGAPEFASMITYVSDKESVIGGVR